MSVQINTWAMDGTAGATVQLADSPLLAGGAVSVSNRPVYAADAGIDGTAIDFSQDTSCFVGPDLGADTTGDIYMTVYTMQRAAALGFILQVLDSAIANAAQIRFTATGQIQMRSGTSVVATTTTAVTLNQWNRVEWRVNRGLTTQTLNLYTGSNIYGTVPNETVTGSFTSGNAAGVRRIYSGANISATGGRVRNDRLSWSFVDFAPPYGTPPPPVGIQDSFRVVIGGAEVPAVAVNVIQSGTEVPATAFSVT